MEIKEKYFEGKIQLFRSKELKIDFKMTFDEFLDKMKEIKKVIEIDGYCTVNDGYRILGAPINIEIYDIFAWIWTNKDYRFFSMDVDYINNIILIEPVNYEPIIGIEY